MTLEHQLDCSECGETLHVAIDVPARAWQPNGAFWEFTYTCDHCGAELILEGRVESSIEY